jgi:hypothetical protein
MKTNASGSMKWQYRLPPAEIPVYDPHKSVDDAVDIGESPVYTSAVVMADDSVFLCGNIPGKKGGPGILTHLDKDGKFLGEQLIHPEGFIGIVLHSCLAWNKGIALSFVTTTEIPKADIPKPTSHNPFPLSMKFLYLIMYRDESGNTMWSKTAPQANNVIATEYRSPLQATADGGIVFVTREGDHTEVTHVDSSGTITTKLLDGRFMLALPASGEKDTQLISPSTSSFHRSTFIRLTLNNDLQEMSRVTGKEGLEYVEATGAYRLPDESIMLFGMRYDSGKERAAVINLDSDIQNASALSLPSDSYLVTSAEPASSQGDFVCIRPIKRTSGNFYYWGGFAMDFIAAGSKAKMAAFPARLFGN